MLADTFNEKHLFNIVLEQCIAKLEDDGFCSAYTFKLTLSMNDPQKYDSDLFKQRLHARTNFTRRVWCFIKKWWHNCVMTGYRQLKFKARISLSALTTTRNGKMLWVARNFISSQCFFFGFSSYFGQIQLVSWFTYSGECQILFQLPIWKEIVLNFFYGFLIVSPSLKSSISQFHRKMWEKTHSEKETKRGILSLIGLTRRVDLKKT